MLYKHTGSNQKLTRPARHGDTVYRDTHRSAVLDIHGSGRVCPGVGGSRSRCALTGILEPQEIVLPGSNLLGGAGFIAWRVKHPSLGECRRRSPKHFGAAGRVWATALRLDPPKKRPCATHVQLVGRSINTTRPLGFGPAQLYIVKQCSSLNSSPTFPSLNPHYNRPSGSLTLCQVLSAGRQ